MAAGHRVRRKFAHVARTLVHDKPKSKPRAMVPVPPEWEVNSWEDKARQNPLFAVMTTEHFTEAQADNFSEEQLQVFYAKGQKIFDAHLRPRLSGDKSTFVVEYGCGMGRILKAVLGQGYQCAGIDISSTMLEHCRRLVPAVNALYVVDESGRCALLDHTADFVFSYAVLQHIDKLSTYLTAVGEICRVLKPGGTFAIQVNCEDLTHGLDRPGRTENFEDHSVHYRPVEAKPYSVHPQSTWSGVYIGGARLRQELSAHRCEIDEIYYHNPSKLRAIWVVGRKSGH